MLRKNPSGHLPVIDQSAYVDQTAIICGKVIVHANVFIGPYAVIRADETDENGEMEPIIIGSNSNIQDGVVIHSKAGASVVIGENTSIAHRSIIHGPCEIGHHVFVGFNSVIFNSKVGHHSAIRRNAVVDGRDLPNHFYVPAMSYINSKTDLDQYPPVDISISEFSESVVSTNIELVKGYKALQNEF
ncbi:carbonate dehydratase [Acinetobacter oleivorans]|uniref:Carbonate dehydratase n=1 Tax=Acinetobacter oleivorans TaxID=1148157 RepID=A0ABR9NF53_9GAMM|nr:carbonate dehydratase [Acinetobacter oleivorans]MBE2163531.1 carbonate dehydratase [Acinetobacter oleivorans]